MEWTVLTQPYLLWMLHGALMTALLAVAGLVVAIPLALLIAGMRDDERLAPRLLGSAAIVVGRSLPPVPLLLLAAAVLPPALHGPALLAVLGCNTAAYLAACLEAGSTTVPSRQREAGRLLGLGRWTLLWRVVWPQAVRTAWPDITTRLVHHLKNTSLAAVLPLALAHQELLGQAARMAGETFVWDQPLILALAVLLLYAGLMQLACEAIGRRLMAGGRP